MYVLDKINKQKGPLLFPLRLWVGLRQLNGLVVGQFMGEVYESLPGHDPRLSRVIINKGEGNDRSIDCVSYKENACLWCDFNRS